MQKLGAEETAAEFVGCLHLLARLVTEVNRGLFAIVDAEREKGFDLLGVLCGELFDGSKRKYGTGAGLVATVKLLLEYAKKEPNRTRILPAMVQFHQDQLRCNIKDAGNESGTRGPGTYVGLKNFGCTCYINSLLQQLFMMVELREELLRLETDKVAAAKCDNVIPNLQRIFGHLLFSQQQYYAPNDFCKEFKGYNKQAINVRVQQDVDEFFNMLTEKAENELKLVGRATLFRDLMKIVVLQEINSLEEKFPYTSPKEEEYLSLPLDIKGKRSIEEALDAFVKEEYLEGENMYRCDKYEGQKIRAVKKFSITQLPKILVVNLKRFEFNYATNTKQKLNDYCEFPLKLNFQKWSKTDGKVPAAEYDYDLVGVLLHSGTADGGHYFSYIKERDKASSNYGRWFEFNDTRVSPFSVTDLKLKAFGSQKPRSGYDAFGWDTSAYLLVYQKSGTDVASTATLSAASNPYSASILQENLSMANAKIYLNPQYQNFVREFVGFWSPVKAVDFPSADSDSCDLIRSRAKEHAEPMTDRTETEDDTIACPEDPYQTVCRLAATDAHNMLEKQPGAKIFGEWIAVLTPHVEANARFGVWYVKFVTKAKGTLFSLLLETSAEDVRTAYIAMLKPCLQKVATQEKDYLAVDEKFTRVSPNTKSVIERTVPKSAAARLMTLLINECFSYARANWQRFDPFFRMLCDLISINVECVRRAVNEGLIGKLIDFVSNTETPLDAIGTVGARPKMGDKTKNVSFEWPMKLLSLLVRSCSTGATREKKSCCKYLLNFGLVGVPELPTAETELLFSSKWKFTDLLSQSKESLCSLLVHLSWEDAKMSETVITALTKALLDKHMTPPYKTEFEALRELLGVKDGVAKQRVSAFLHVKADFKDSLYDWLESKSNYWVEFTLDLLSLIAEMLETREFAESLKEDAPRMAWAVQWVSVDRLHTIMLDSPEETRKKEFIMKQFETVLNWKAAPKAPAQSFPMMPPMGAMKAEEKMQIDSQPPVANPNEVGVISAHVASAGENGKEQSQSLSQTQPLDDVVDLDAANANAISDPKANVSGAAGTSTTDVQKNEDGKNGHTATMAAENHGRQ